MTTQENPDSHILAKKYPQAPDWMDRRGIGYQLPTFPQDPPDLLAGKRVLFMSADGPELPELDVPLEYLRARGAKVDIAGQDWIFQYRDPAGYIVIAEWLSDELCVRADLRLSDVRVNDYDAIFIPGGAWNPDMLRTDGQALRIVREARAENKLIVSLCHGPQVFINAEVFPPGTHITGVGSIRLDLRNAGFTVHEDTPTVYDQDCRLLTARDPNDLGPLCQEMGSLLCQP